MCNCHTWLSEKQKARTQTQTWRSVSREERRTLSENRAEREAEGRRDPANSTRRQGEDAEIPRWDGKTDGRESRPELINRLINRSAETPPLLWTGVS